MSKAFTREDAGVPEEPDDEEQDLPKAGAKRYITPQGFKKLEAEVAHLWKVERPKVTQEVSDAAAQGDRSENAEYIYGKKRLREIDRRIRFLTKRLDSAEVVDPAARARSGEGTDQIFFGATVRYANARGEAHEITIVGIDEVDPARGHVSWISPIARALLKAREGDTVQLRTPAGVETLDVLEVRYG